MTDPTPETVLRDSIDAALHEVLNRHLGQGAWTGLRAEVTDAVLAVLPEPADRAAVLLEAAERVLDADHLPFVSPMGRKDVAALLRRLAGETANNTPETPFTPPTHYRGSRDGTAYCVHAIPVGPNSCPACRELAEDDGPAAVPNVLDEVVAALQAKAQALSVEAEEEMRRDLEEQAQVWHEAADLARRAARKAARGAQAVVEARQDGSR